jgi:hypothetical protein
LVEGYGGSGVALSTLKATGATVKAALAPAALPPSSAEARTTSAEAMATE